MLRLGLGAYTKLLCQIKSVHDCPVNSRRAVAIGSVNREEVLR